MSRWIGLCVLGACATPAAAPVENPVPAPPPFFAIVDTGLGPIGKDTPANLTAIRELVGPHGYAVRPINDGGIEFHVYDGKEHLFYVIPNDNGSLFNVHVVATSIPITQHPEWVIGKPLLDSRLLTYCEAWGDHPVCWRGGDHVALGFAVDTDDLDTPEGRMRLEGVTIQRAVWRAKPFGTDDDDAPAEPPLPRWIPRSDS